MAFGFKGFEVGKELGAGLAKSRDLSPLGTYLLRYGAQQKELHQRMLQYAAREIGSFNPKGVMRPDMPIVIDKYERWKMLMMEHPEAVLNPRSKWFDEIDDAKKDLLATTDVLVDGAKQAAALTKMISTSELKGHHLSEEGVQKYQYLMQNGVSGFMNKYPGEVNFDEAIIPTMGETAQQVQTELKNASNWGTPAKVLVDTGHGIKTTWSKPSSGYVGMIVNSGKRFGSMSTTTQNYLNNRYNNLLQNSPETLNAIEDELKNEYEGLPEGVVSPAAKKTIANFKITDGASLNLAEELMSHKPELVSSGVSDEAKLQHMEFGEKVSTERINQAAQRIGLEADKLNDTRYKDFVSQVYKMAKPLLDRFKAANQADPNWKLKDKNGMAINTKQQLDKAYNQALNMTINSRVASGQFVPKKYEYGNAQEKVSKMFNVTEGANFFPDFSNPADQFPLTKKLIDTQNNQ